jgi:hypothetical protein
LLTAAGGLGHALPFPVSGFHLAFAAAVPVVAIELAVISYVRHRYMNTPLFSSALQVIVGGSLVFAVEYGSEAEDKRDLDRVLLQKHASRASNVLRTSGPRPGRPMR